MEAYENTRFNPSGITLDHLYVLRQDRSARRLVKCCVPLRKDEAVSAHLENSAQTIRQTLLSNADMFIKRLPLREAERTLSANPHLKYCSELCDLSYWWKSANNIRQSVDFVKKHGLTRFDGQIEGAFRDVFVREWQVPPIPEPEHARQLLEAHYKERSQYIHMSSSEFCEKTLTAFGRLAALSKQAFSERQSFLRACEQAFVNYLDSIESGAPGILKKRKYCRSLSGAYAKAELNAVRDLTNFQIITEPERYFHALILDREYQKLDADDSVIAYSTRTLGWRTFEAKIKSDGTLSLETKTNFGYGHATYHYLRVLFHEVPVINAYELVLYRNINYAEVLDATETFGYDECCFKDCIDAMEEYISQYYRLGPAAFAEKYVFGQIRDLANLLSAVCAKTTFFEVEDPKFLTKLSNCDANLLFTDARINEVGEGLSPDDLRILDQAIQNRVSFGQAGFPLAQFRVNEMAGRNESASFARSFMKAKAANIYLAKSLVKQGLDAASAQEFANSMIRIPENIRIDHLTGYELVEARIRRANNVFKQLGNIEAVMAYSSDKSSLRSIKASLISIALQADRYCVEAIAPEIASLAIEAGIVSEQLNKAKTAVNELRNTQGATLKEAQERVSELAEEYETLKSKISLLDSKKEYLQSISSKILDADAVSNAANNA